MNGPAHALALALVAVPITAAAGDYAIDPAASRILVHVGKSGVLGFAGHEHEVAAAPSGGRIVADPGELSASSVTVALRTRDLRVVATKEKKGDDAPKVQAAMERDVLEVDRHPDITFTSTVVRGRETAPGRYALEITGTLALHGVQGSLVVPVEVVRVDKVLTATGRFVVRHDAFGLKRVSAGAGTVRVANELAIDFTLVAAEAAP
jgi:polyisoprenoid-binding protein YceI